ncbi:MAG: extradiol dioxygenase [Deltaproteobacteria bacterium]
MISGAHVIIYSKDADADRAFLRDILQLGSVDVGGGWLIFGLPPSEVAVHPSGNNDLHELYLMCDDVVAFIREMLARDISCSPVEDQGWGLLTSLTLPGGGKLGVYEPRHERPEPTLPKLAKKKARRAVGKKPPKRSSTTKKKKAKRKATGGRRPRAR